MGQPTLSLPWVTWLPGTMGQPVPLLWGDLVTGDDGSVPSPGLPGMMHQPTGDLVTRDEGPSQGLRGAGDFTVGNSAGSCGICVPTTDLDRCFYPRPVGHLHMA